MLQPPAPMKKPYNHCCILQYELLLTMNTQSVFCLSFLRLLYNYTGIGSKAFLDIYTGVTLSSFVSTKIWNNLEPVVRELNACRLRRCSLSEVNHCLRSVLQGLSCCQAGFTARNRCDVYNRGWDNRTSELLQGSWSCAKTFGRNRAHGRTLAYNTIKIMDVWKLILIKGTADVQDISSYIFLLFTTF